MQKDKDNKNVNFSNNFVEFERSENQSNQVIKWLKLAIN